MTDEKIKLRSDMELIPIMHQGKRFVLIRDPLGLVEEGKAVSMSMFQFMTLLDGTRDIRELQIEMMRQRGGMIIGTDEIERLIEELDQSFFLDTERYKDEKKKIIERFKKQEIRPCYHCGRSYPMQKERLNSFIEDILSLTDPAPPEGEIVALISPHIDIQVGKRLYSLAYSFAEFSSAEIVIILGVGHQFSDAIFSLTKKRFQMPYGVVETHIPIVDRLLTISDSCISSSDFAHKTEHSIEFQLLFLQHTLRSPFKIVPILCGPLLPFIGDHRRDLYLKKTERFLNTLKDVIEENSDNILIVAGVDLSHIGPKFGHQYDAHTLAPRAKRHDNILLDALGSGDSERFWEEISAVKDYFNVCGFSALACLLEILPPSKGKILGYEMWHEEATHSAVSFASLLFTA